jgi:hypothetical protein
MLLLSRVILRDTTWLRSDKISHYMFSYDNPNDESDPTTRLIHAIDELVTLGFAEKLNSVHSFCMIWQAVLDCLTHDELKFIHLTLLKSRPKG